MITPEILPFTHLHLHSEYSLRDGLMDVGELVKAVKAKGMKAVALTDRMNLFAAVKFYRAAISAGIKPIIGCEVILRDSAESPEVSVVFLCQNAMGYRHLIQMLSRAYTENQDVNGPWVKYDWLAMYSEGLIVLLNYDDTLVDKLAVFWTKLFPDRVYLEIQRVDKPDEKNDILAVIALAKALDLPIVATNDVRFLETEDFDAHEARVCIHEGLLLEDKGKYAKSSALLYTPQQYLRSPEAMQACFQDYPEAIENAIELAKRCNVHIVLDQTHLPCFPVPDAMTADTYLTQMAHEGLSERLQHTTHQSQHPRADYDARLAIELAVIHRMGFSGYFLIVADFIQWAKNHQIPVGPGRGSGAGSLVAYVLKITDLDPLVHELLFERFLNPERVSMPDFDIDFCVEGRDRVIEYVAQKYGRDKVAQIITYGTMAAKAVVRDVGRVLGHPYGFVDQIAKLIPFELGMTLDKALEQEEELKKRYTHDEDVKALLDLALKLEGTIRNVGKHAGGVVIAPSALTDFTPLYCESASYGAHAGDNQVTQFDKGDVEAVGLVKFDFLGLKTLTIIHAAVKNIERRSGQYIDITLLSIDDSKTFALLKTAKTDGLFQLESRGMRDLVHRLQLDCFDDIMALVALYRPGPLQSGMVDDFIDRKQGKTPVVYPHPELEPILKPTYGVILYQEQVMQIAQTLAGYTLGGADILRSAMGKKKVEEMAKQRQIFIDGAVARGVEDQLAAHIFDLMEKFAGYGFNKSHSAAYALVSYQTAWLKAHYPAEFMAAVLSADMDNTDKLKDFMPACQLMHVIVNPPNIHQSEYLFTVNMQGEVLYGLGAIKGVGQAAVELMITERNVQGYFTSLFDLCQRVDLRKISRRVLEALIGAGACDVWGVDRGILLANMDNAIKLAEKMKHQINQGQHDLFHLLEESVTEKEIVYQSAPVWDVDMRLSMEKEKLGFYLSGHPFEAYREECQHFIADKLADLDPKQSPKVTIGGLVIDIRKIITKKGKKMALITLEDDSGKLSVAIFAELLDASRDILHKGEILIIQGEIAFDEYTNGIRMRADKIMNMPMARTHYGKYLQLAMQAADINDASITACHQLLQQYATGDMPIQISYHHVDASIAVHVGDHGRISPENTLLSALNQLEGIHAIVVY